MSGALPITGYADRLSKAADAVDERKEQLALARAHRNSIVLESVDGGYPQSAAARHARISQPHVVRLIAASYAGLSDLAA